MTGETIDKVKAFVEVRRIPGGAHHPIEQMRRWKGLVTQEIVNQLDGISLVTPVMWKRNSMENWWAGHPEDDAKDGIPEGTPSTNYYKYTWFDAVRDTLDYLGARLSSLGITDHGESVRVGGITESSVMSVMRFIILNSGFGGNKVFFHKKEDQNTFLLRFTGVEDSMDDDGWKRYTWSDAKFDEAKEDGRAVDMNALNN